jgi:hypothetical protein
LDKFYTKEEIVKKLTNMVNLKEYDLIVEPSAGDGAFLASLPASKTIALDLFPEGPNIARQDFFEFKVEPNKYKKVLTIGNPPFGKNSSLAVKFFNHAAKYSDTIAFVLPRTFRKSSTLNKLDLNFHLIKEQVLPKDCFYLPSGGSHSTPAIVQVWSRQTKPRQKEKLLTTHPDFTFLGSEDFRYSTVDLSVSASLGYFGATSDIFYEMGLDEYESIKILRKKYPKLFSDHRVTSAKKDIEWIRKPDFAFRRAGSRAGEIFTDYTLCPLQGFEFIKAANPQVMEIFKTMWEERWNPTNHCRLSEKWDTAGQPSISKHELISFYIETKQKTKELEIEE